MKRTIAPFALVHFVVLTLVFTSGIARAQEEQAGSITLSAIDDFPVLKVDGYAQMYRNEERDRVVEVDGDKSGFQFGAVQTTFGGPTAHYDVTIHTRGDGDGACKYLLMVNGKPAGNAFLQPEASEGEWMTHTWKNVAVKKGDTLTVASNGSDSAQNAPGLGPRGFHMAHGRWSKLVFAPASPATDQAEEGFESLFNGEDLTGWMISEDGQWRVEDGQIVATGPRSHLYTQKQFKNFELKADVMTTPGSNSGIYFHTKFQPTGWPQYGYESQVNVTHRDPVKSGSLYGVVKLYETPAKDLQWNKHHLIVDGRNIVVKINGQTVIDYTEPEGVTGPRRLSSGSIALQAHDPHSTVYYRNIRVKELAE